MSRNIRRVVRREISPTYYPSANGTDIYNPMTRQVPTSVCATGGGTYCPVPYDTRLYMIEETIRKLQCQVDELTCTVNDQEKQICELKEISNDHSCKLDYLRDVTCEQGNKIETLHCYYCEQEKKIECIDQEICRLDKTVCCHTQQIECLEKANCEINEKLDYLKCSDCNQNKKIDELDCVACEQQKSIDCLTARVECLECGKKNACNLGNSCQQANLPIFESNMRPPVVFDGYTVTQKTVYSPCGNVCYWFLIPETSVNRVTYRFSYNRSICKYVYEPVNCNDYSIVYPPNANDPVNVTFIYDNLQGDCYFLIQYLYHGRLAYPLNIIGYKYGPIPISACITSFGFIPCQPMYANGFNMPCCDQSQSPCCNQSQLPCEFNTCNTIKSYIFNFTPLSQAVDDITYQYAVLESEFGSTNYNYPSSITSLTGCDISNDVTQFLNGVGLSLPYDNCTYRVAFTAELRINSSNDYINLLAGSGIIPNQAAVVRLQTRYVDSSGTFIEDSGSEISFNWTVMCTNGSSNTPPANFKINTDPAYPGAAGTYYMSCLTNQEVIANISYPPSTLGPDGRPYGRRVITFATDPAFSINSVTVKVSRY